MVRTEIAGVFLGEKGQPRSTGTEALLARGVVVHPITVSRLRMGDTNGHKIAERLTCAGVLTDGSAQAKNRFCMQLTGCGLTEGFDSAGYTEKIALSLQEDAQVVRRAIRAMRADFVYESVSAESDLSELFLNAYDRCLSRYQDRRSYLWQKTIKDFEARWNHQSILDFYQILYQGSVRRRIGFWTPYEMEALHRFYTGQALAGNPLTQLDRVMLLSYARGELSSALVEQVRDQTGIPIDEHVVYVHRNLLVYGRAA